jgi:DNA-binding YbaB/EbfC family protein
MKGLGNLGNMGKMVKQAQEMQAKMLRAQEELATKEVEATAGGGAVTVRMNGKQDVISVKISPEVVDPKEVEMLEDLMVAAYREAKKKAEDLAKEELSKATGGMDIPGLF